MVLNWCKVLTQIPLCAPLPPPATTIHVKTNFMKKRSKKLFTIMTGFWTVFVLQWMSFACQTVRCPLRAQFKLIQAIWNTRNNFWGFISNLILVYAIFKLLQVQVTDTQKLSCLETSGFQTVVWNLDTFVQILDTFSQIMHCMPRLDDFVSEILTDNHWSRIWTSPDFRHQLYCTWANDA